VKCKFMCQATKRVRLKARKCKKARLCFWCGRKTRQGKGRSERLTKDHYVPKSKGGKFIVPACYQCNQAKAARMPSDFAQIMHLALTDGPPP